MSGHAAAASQQSQQLQVRRRQITRRGVCSARHQRTRRAESGAPTTIEWKQCWTASEQCHTTNNNSQSTLTCFVRPKHQRRTHNAVHAHRQTDRRNKQYAIRNTQYANDDDVKERKKAKERTTANGNDDERSQRTNERSQRQRTKSTTTNEVNERTKSTTTKSTTMNEVNERTNEVNERSQRTIHSIRPFRLIYPHTRSHVHPYD